MEFDKYLSNQDKNTKHSQGLMANLAPFSKAVQTQFFLLKKEVALGLCR